MLMLLDSLFHVKLRVNTNMMRCFVAFCGIELPSEIHLVDGEKWQRAAKLRSWCEMWTKDQFRLITTRIYTTFVDFIQASIFTSIVVIQCAFTFSDCPILSTCLRSVVDCVNIAFCAFDELEIEVAAKWWGLPLRNARSIQYIRVCVYTVYSWRFSSDI